MTTTEHAQPRYACVGCFTTKSAGPAAKASRSTASTTRGSGRSSTPAPRFCGPDPSFKRLHAANENGHTIVELDIGHQTGKLTPTGQVIETGSPACIAFKTHQPPVVPDASAIAAAIRDPF